MLRQIISSSEASFTLNFPGDMIGKTIEIIAFEINDPGSLSTLGTKADRVREIESITKKTLVDLSSYKFNRNDANDYEE